MSSENEAVDSNPDVDALAAALDTAQAQADTSANKVLRLRRSYLTGAVAGYSFMLQPAFEKPSTKEVDRFLTKHKMLP